MPDPRPERSSEEPGLSFCTYGFRYIRKSWLALVKEATGAVGGEDPEHVHRMRVASRRVRAAMPIFRTCFPEKKYRAWRTEMKTITASLGHARDLDVQIAFLRSYLQKHPEAGTDQGYQASRPGESPADLPTLLRLLQQKRDQAQPAVGAAAAAIPKGPLREFGEYLSSLERKHKKTGGSAKLSRKAAKSVASRTASLLSYEPWVSDPGAVTRHHEMRIAAKRLRYTLEAFNRLSSGTLKASIRKVRALQDILGELHDCDVWIGCLTALLQEQGDRDEFCGRAGGTGIAGLLEDRTRERARLYRTFVEMWNGLKDARFFETLGQRIISLQEEDTGK